MTPSQHVESEKMGSENAISGSTPKSADTEAEPSAAAIIHELQYIRVGMLDQYSAATILERLVAKAQRLPISKATGGAS